MMMQKELMPLMIPSGNSTRSVACENRTARDEGHDQSPPQVPPKSPRTESRASPRPKQMAHSASSSTSTLHSTSSSATSFSSVSGKCSPQPFHNLHQVGSRSESRAGSQAGSQAGSRAGSPLPQRSGLSNGEGQSSSISVKNQDRFGRRTPPRAESPHTIAGAFVHQKGIGRQTPPLVRSLSSDPDLVRSNETHVTLVSSPKIDRVGSSRTDRKGAELVIGNKVPFGHAKPLWHQRGNSEASPLNRVQSTNKADSPMVQRLDRTALKGPALSEEKTVLPTGLRLKDVSGKLRDSDLKELKAQADEQVKTFEVLSVKDVSNLSKVS